ncbi:hypothetical protein [Streptomyces chattanoogensis]|uniref:hypothetical protein n=1 Tax=Streptomyces chattanoogensis TaxID=66876 RepID=UPI0036B46B00
MKKLSDIKRQARRRALGCGSLGKRPVRRPVRRLVRRLGLPVSCGEDKISAAAR